MADIKGSWRIGFIPEFGEDGELKFITRDEALKSKKVDNDLKYMLKAIYVITEDSMAVRMPLTGKEKQEAIKEGFKEVEEGIYEVEVTPIIKKENDYFFELGYDEMNDEPHLEPLRLDEEGHLEYILFKLERV